MPGTTTPPKWRLLNAAAARAAKYGDKAEAERLKAESRAERLTERVEQLLADAPPLNSEQKARISGLLASPKGRKVTEEERRALLADAEALAKNGGRDA